MIGLISRAILTNSAPFPLLLAITGRRAKQVVDEFLKEEVYGKRVKGLAGAIIKNN